MSIIRLEWEDAVAALLNMLCKDRIHDYGKHSGSFVKQTKTFSGLAGGSNIIDEALKIEVLNALAKQVVLTNDEKINMYCITNTETEAEIPVIDPLGDRYYLIFDNCDEREFQYGAFKNYIISDSEGHEESFEYQYQRTDEGLLILTDDGFFNPTIKELISFIEENMCINILDIKSFCNQRTAAARNPQQLHNIDSKIKRIIKSKFNSILDKIVKYLYSILDKIKLVNKLLLFRKIIDYYNRINAKATNQSFTNPKKHCQLKFILILLLIFLKYMSYYICKQICVFYDELKTSGRFNIHSREEITLLLQELKVLVDAYLLGTFGTVFGPALSRIIVNILYNNERFGTLKFQILLFQIKQNIDTLIDYIYQSLFSNAKITELLTLLCNEQNIKNAFSDIIEEKQIQVSLSFFFYDMLNIQDKDENNDLINEIIGIYTKPVQGRAYPIPTKIGDIGFLLRMIISNIEKLEALTTDTELEDDSTIKYLHEMRDILIKIFKKKVETEEYFGRCRENLLNPHNYGYYINYIETRLENETPKRIDYTFKDICTIVEEDILLKLKISKLSLNPNSEIAQSISVEDAGPRLVVDGAEVAAGVHVEEMGVQNFRPSRRRKISEFGDHVEDEVGYDGVPAGGGKKISNKIISYDDIYYIIQSSLGLYNTSNNYYGGGDAENNWYEMFKQFTLMALGIKELKERTVAAAAVPVIDHIGENYNKFFPIESPRAFNFNQAVEDRELFSDWFNFEKSTIAGKGNLAISKKIENHESTYMRRLFISNNFSIPGVINAVNVAGAPIKYPIIDDVMSLRERYRNLVDGRPLFSQAADWYDWFNSPPVNIPNIANLQNLKLKVTPENSYANVKFPIYDEQVFNDDLFPLISKNIKDLSSVPPAGPDEYKMKYIVNNEATSISSEIGFNELYNYASFSDPGSSGSDITKLLEYGEKYIMGFYGVTRIQFIQKPAAAGSSIIVPVNYLPGSYFGPLPHITNELDGTPINLLITPVQFRELITDGYITILDPVTQQHKIKIYSTKHNKKFNMQTPNNFMATYECERLPTDFGVDKWQGVSLAVALKTSLDVLKKYMDSFIGKYYNSGVLGAVNVPFINTTSGTWKEWEFLFNDYGVLRIPNNDARYPNERINTKYKSIPNDFVLGINIPGEIIGVDFIAYPVWNNILPSSSTVYTTTAAPALGNMCWLRLPCFSIFNQISIFKGNGDICQELYTLTKFGGIYQDNIFHKTPGFDGYNPENLDNDTLRYLQTCQVYPTANYTKELPPFAVPNNYYGAGARKINPAGGGSFTPAGVANPLSISDPKYIPYDRFGNAPRGFVSGDRLSGLRYIMLSFLGLKYYIRRICDNRILNPGTALSLNQQLCNNINILSFGGYNSGLVSSIMSKINFNFINKIYANKIGLPRNDQIYDILTSLYTSLGNNAAVAALPALQPSNRISLLTNYAGINAGGGKKSKTLKKKLGKKNIKKRTKKISKKYKKTIKKIKNIKKQLKKSKIRKTYKNKK